MSYYYNAGTQFRAARDDDSVVSAMSQAPAQDATEYSGVAVIDLHLQLLGHTVKCLKNSDKVYTK